MPESIERSVSPENLSPVFTSFESIFRALEQPFPKPEVYMQLGYRGPSPEYNVHPHLRATFRGDSLELVVSSRISDKTRDEIFKLAERRIDNRFNSKVYGELNEAPEGKIVIEAGSAPVSEQWKLLCSEKLAISTLDNIFSFANTGLRYSLITKPPHKLCLPDHLGVEFGSYKVGYPHELHLLSPRVNFQKILGIQTPLAKEHSQRVENLAQAILRELGPVWQYWHDRQSSPYQQDPKILEILNEIYEEAFEKLRGKDVSVDYFSFFA
ncbi:MAG: hypothetical protein P8Y17_00615 [Patescibacteria group bacterium]|jgi:hypothetical protein